MANAANSGKIPEYTAQDTKAWLDGRSAGLTDLTNTLVIVLMVIGLVVFAAGVIQIMKEGREAASGGGGGRPRYGVYMALGGGALGSISGIFLFIVALIKPLGT